MKVVRSNRFRIGAGVATLSLAADGLAGCVPQPAAGITCAWGTKGGRSSANVAYPDATATYFGTSYTLSSGQKLVLSGTYALARYTSLHTYSASGNAVDHLADSAIVPDAGSDNPSTNAAASSDPAHRKWTVTISPDAPALDGAGGTNTMGTSAVGTVLLRVYVPNDAFDDTGSVGLPSMKVVDSSGATTATFSTCASQAADPNVTNLINLFGPATDLPPTVPLEFKRPATVAGLYANRDNTYISAIVAHEVGKVVVVRGKAPTTPDTRAGESMATPSQLRYWSFCTNEYVKPYPVSACVVDHDAPVDASGYYTIVTSTAADRPANATLANGIAWVDWGSTSVNMLMLMRHMLPAASFAEAAQNVAPGQSASAVMGEYTPVAVICDVATFESGGAAACGS